MTSSSGALEDIQVLILAGGLGSRISPVLGATPKVLAPVEGRPYLDYFVDWMAGFGARHITFSLGHLADAIVDYVESRGWPVKMDWVIEPEPMGTAGALRFARPALTSPTTLVCNGDSFVDADLAAFTRHHARMKAEASLLCVRIPDAARYGQIAVDEEGWITDFKEKGEGGPGLINAGLYLLSDSFLNQVAQSTARSLENDVFAKAPPRTLSAFSGEYGFIDIGTPESLRSATASMLTSSARRA